MELALIGAGRAGQTLQALLAAVDIPTRLVISRSAEASGGVQTLQASLPSEIARCEGVLSELPLDTLLLFALPDDVLPAAVAAVAEVRGSWDAFSVLHCSGVLDAEVLSPFREKGAQVGSLHPCTPIFRPQTILPDVVYTYSGEAELGKRCREWVTSWRASFVELQGIDRTLYHAACVFSAGHLVSLLATSAKLLVESGVTEQDALDISQSIARGAFSNLAKESASGLNAYANSLTGPYVREDVETIQRHLERLSQSSDEARQLYELLGKVSRGLKNSLSS